MNANQLSSLAQRYGSYLLKAFGLFAVIYVVCAVTSARFETLREQSVGLPSGYISAAQRTRELDCLTRNIYWEAANEPFEGKVGVAQVTLNRVESGKFANSVCAVVYQKNVFYEKVVCQFSWFCESGNCWFVWFLQFPYNQFQNKHVESFRRICLDVGSNPTSSTS